MRFFRILGNPEGHPELLAILRLRAPGRLAVWAGSPKDSALLRSSFGLALSIVRWGWLVFLLAFARSCLEKFLLVFL